MIIGSVTVLLVFCCHQLLAIGSAVSEFSQTVYRAKVLPSSHCDQNNGSVIDEDLMEALTQVAAQLPTPHHSSCMDIHNDDPSAPSGYYTIIAANGSSVQVYCDMEGTNCGGEGGWTRVTYLNMTQPGATCPQGLVERNFTQADTLLCGRASEDHVCNGTMFPTLVEYFEVCGQVQGYQYGTTTAFRSYILNNNLTIDDAYVNGVSITYGSAPRNHIWTYANGLHEHNNSFIAFGCPCNQGSGIVSPPYIGNDYYCESALAQFNPIASECCYTPYSNTCCLLYSTDPLWDGQQCGGGEAPCCTHPNMPWFIKTLNETTTNYIELRMCGDDFNLHEDDTPLEIIEMYIR